MPDKPLESKDASPQSESFSALARELSEQLDARKKSDGDRSYLGRAVDSVVESVLGDGGARDLAELKRRADRIGQTGDRTDVGALASEIKQTLERTRKDGELNQEVSHYATGFSKTVPLFLAGKLGLAGTVAAYALDQMNPDASLKTQLTDGLLGAAKGGLLKGTFNYLGARELGVAYKGIALGTTSRILETGLTRSTYAGSGGEFSLTSGLSKTLSTSLDAKSLLADATIFALAHGLAGKANALTLGKIERSPFLNTIMTGGTFGMSSGATGEIMRQNAAGENFDAGKVVRKALIQGTVDMFAAAPGGVQTDRGLRARIRESAGSSAGHLQTRVDALGGQVLRLGDNLAGMLAQSLGLNSGLRPAYALAGSYAEVSPARSSRPRAELPTRRNAMMMEALPPPPPAIIEQWTAPRPSTAVTIENLAVAEAKPRTPASERPPGGTSPVEIGLGNGHLRLSPELVEAMAAAARRFNKPPAELAESLTRRKSDGTPDWAPGEVAVRTLTDVGRFFSLFAEGRYTEALNMAVGKGQKLVPVRVRFNEIRGIDPETLPDVLGRLLFEGAEKTAEATTIGENELPVQTFAQLPEARVQFDRGRYRFGDGPEIVLEHPEVVTLRDIQGASPAARQIGERFLQSELGKILQATQAMLAYEETLVHTRQVRAAADGNGYYEPISPTMVDYLRHLDKGSADPNAPARPGRFELKEIEVAALMSSAGFDVRTIEQILGNRHLEIRRPFYDYLRAAEGLPRFSRFLAHESVTADGRYEWMKYEPLPEPVKSAEQVAREKLANQLRTRNLERYADRVDGVKMEAKEALGVKLTDLQAAQIARFREIHPDWDLASAVSRERRGEIINSLDPRMNPSFEPTIKAHEAREILARMKQAGRDAKNDAHVEEMLVELRTVRRIRKAAGDKVQMTFQQALAAAGRA